MVFVEQMSGWMNEWMHDTWIFEIHFLVGVTSHSTSVSSLIMRHGRHCKLSPVRTELLPGTTEAQQGIWLTTFENQSFLNLMVLQTLPFPCSFSANLCHVIHMRPWQAGTSTHKNKYIPNKVLNGLPWIFQSSPFRRRHTSLPILQCSSKISSNCFSISIASPALILWHLDCHNRSLQPLSSVVNLYTIKKSYMGRLLFSWESQNLPIPYEILQEFPQQTFQILLSLALTLPFSLFP